MDFGGVSKDRQRDEACEYVDGFSHFILLL